MTRIAVLILFLISACFATAQSLKPENPYALKQGINQATSDSLVGTHYWYFYAMPGSNRLTVRFKNPTTLYGAKMDTVLTITVTDDKRTWRTVKTVTSTRTASEATFTAEKLSKRQKILVSVAPPNQNLLRMGGEYEIEATGDVDFDETAAADPKNSVADPTVARLDPVVRTYSPKVMQNGEEYGSVKFNANGTIETANGFRGTWKVFDRENRIYSFVIENIRYSLQYSPGYGLVRPNEPNVIEFQELRR